MPEPAISDELFERCLRALHHAPADKPSLELLLDMTGDPEGLRNAVALAYQAGRESALDWDEWRVRAKALFREWSNNASFEAATESLRWCRRTHPDAWIEHRRTGATEWQEVATDAA